MNTKPPSPLVLGPRWQRFEYNGRSFAVDPNELDSVELTPDGWVFKTVPTCVVVRDGDAVGESIPNTHG